MYDGNTFRTPLFELKGFIPSQITRSDGFPILSPSAHIIVRKSRECRVSAPGSVGVGLAASPPLPIVTIFSIYLSTRFC